MKHVQNKLLKLIWRLLPWFAGHGGTLLAYRVNRRPLSRPSLFTPEIPDDVWDHFLRMLAPGHEITTGHAHQRVCGADRSWSTVHGTVT
jgi:muramidase (phage lysozyme)